MFSCARQAIYSMRGTKQSNPPDERTRRVFRVGHILHEFVQAAIADDPEVAYFFAEVKVYDADRNVTGHADGLYRFVTGAYEVLEIKSINSMAFRYKDLPKPEHRDQVVPYVEALREYGGQAKLPDGTVIEIPPLGDQLNRVRLVYVSKDDMQIEEFTQIHTEAKVDALDERLDILEAHEAAGTLPMRLPPTVKTVKKTGKTTTSRNYLCSYCPFQDKCWKEDPEGVAP